MEYEKQTSIGGNWVKAADIANGTRIKIVSETQPIQTVFEGKPRTQNVAKLKIEGMPEEKNANLNKPTLNALIDAFGKDSKDWMNKVLTAQVEKVQIAGKNVRVLYLIPEGFRMTEDAGGYVVIAPIGKVGNTDIEYPTDENVEDEINPDDIPF